MSYIKASGVHGRPGHAVIEIGYALSVDPLLLTIQKVGADPRYLSRDGGWRADPEPLEPTRVERQEGRTLIYVGPDIVNHLDDDQRLRVGIVSADFAGDVVWSDIPPSSGGVGGAVFIPRTRPVAVEARRRLRRPKSPRSRNTRPWCSSPAGLRRGRPSGIRCGGCWAAAAAHPSLAARAYWYFYMAPAAAGSGGASQRSAATCASSSRR